MPHLGFVGVNSESGGHHCEIGDFDEQLSEIAFASVFDGEPKESKLIEIPVATFAEAARSTRGSVAQIRHLVEALASHSSARP